VVHFALEEMRGELQNSRREELLSRLRQHLRAIKSRQSSGV
jgi:hypothetical protein